mmetsp:Transcript_27959/g.59402  ORF Transcript_27959/g.59402 Transcript_27959/m.59402 type:complete len:124 (+) Transcript_27959:121-492(+)|eukprot:CAMPEP_0172550518 /NCGR_PEP_ID=MMETSP1067-20121228/30023_1 /TAXON_ID=265564 ORGANISM="Thalassiosira punctigera, Strain Tpunct2005C2" /NCGR_SAMPLE_ID=MMETSP1067 /ASSEMBLY_ACC=CAM_ASM_000444 /LENGTH=123 /DNA_ID=CAMNT_0013338123 /DNA_START=106 /DNA_END=477 /DNA_ORIENTATION=+
MKLTALLALLCSSSTSAFVAPRPAAPRNAALQATPNGENLQKLTHAATVAAAALTTTTLASPLVALAEDDEYVYGAVSAPGGIGLAVGLGVVAILTAAVPVILAPGEDAFNEMKEQDKDKWGR